MENILRDDVQNRDGVMSTKEKRAEPGRRRQQLRDSTELLNLPLGVKIPMDPGSSTVLHRTKLGVKLHQPAGHFNLRDPYCHLLGNEYNSLHDPHLQDYYSRKDNLRRLRREGFITKDGKVVCNLHEFNQYRQYLTSLKIEMEKTDGQEQEPKPQGSQKCSKEQWHAKTRTTLNCPGERHVWPLTAGDRGVLCRRQLAKEPKQRDGNGSNDVGQPLPKAEGRKTPTGKMVGSQPRKKVPPLTVRGMVKLSEDEAEAQGFQEKHSAPLLPSIHQSSEHLAQSAPKGMQKTLTLPSPPASRPHSALHNMQPKARPVSTREPFPSIAQQYCRQPVPPAAPKTPSQSAARMRPMRVKMFMDKPRQREC